MKKNSCFAFTLPEVFSIHFKNNRKYAFTLAEVLITLGIIGVVAAMTLPTLLANYQKQRIVTQLKKAYSEMGQAISQAQSDNGTLDAWDFSDLSENRLEETTAFAKHYLFPYIKTIKVCAPSSNECWGDTTYNIDGTAIKIHSVDQADISFVTPTGYSVYMWVHETGTGGWFYIDINGNKKPNTLGKDIFAYTMNWGTHLMDEETRCTIKNGFFPYGVHSCPPIESRDNFFTGENLASSNAVCKKNSGKARSGLSCSGLIMYDNWKISDDYPW